MKFPTFQDYLNESSISVGRMHQVRFSFSNLSNGDTITNSKGKVFTVTAAGFDHCWVTDADGKNHEIKTLIGYAPKEVKALQESLEEGYVWKGKSDPKIQSLYKAFHDNPKNVVCSTDGGKTWETPPMDTGKWFEREEPGGLQWEFKLQFSDEDVKKALAKLVKKMELPKDVKVSYYSRGNYKTIIVSSGPTHDAVNQVDQHLAKMGVNTDGIDGAQSIGVNDNTEESIINAAK